MFETKEETRTLIFIVIATAIVAWFTGRQAGRSEAATEICSGIGDAVYSFDIPYEFLQRVMIYALQACSEHGGSVI